LNQHVLSGTKKLAASHKEYDVQAALLDSCRNLLTELELVSSNQTIEVCPLTGGVASNIALVKLCDRKLCVKFALPKLKVQADWFAPVHRNAAEYAWLQVVATVAPSCAVKLLGQSQKLHGFAMEYLEGPETYLWKTALLNEAPDRGEATKVGKLIGRVHAASSDSAFDTTAFRNRDDFHALRIEPYLLHTATLHSDIAPALQDIATQLDNSDQVLCHGDISPKNIFQRSSGPVILDAECATMGDASFDPAFCINHLILKAVHLPRSRHRNLKSAANLWQEYRPLITWEDANDLEARICRLLPALMLARVDGKSPVEYLSNTESDTVRSISRNLIKSPVDHLDELFYRVGESLHGV